VQVPFRTFALSRSWARNPKRSAKKKLARKKQAQIVCPVPSVSIWLSCRLSCPVYLILAFLCRQPGPGGPILAVLSWQSSPACSVLPAHLAAPLWLSCSSCSVLAVLFWLSFSECPFLVVLSFLFCSGFFLSLQSWTDSPILAALSWKSFHGSPACPVLAVLFQLSSPFLTSPGCPTLAVSSWQPCSVYPIPPIQFYLSCSAYPVLPVLFCLYCSAWPVLSVISACPVLLSCSAVLFCLSCSSCPVLPVLFWLSLSGSSLMSVLS
jgi:hypothetical protein